MFKSEEHVREVEAMTPLEAYKAGWHANNRRYHFEDVGMTLYFLAVAAFFSSLFFLEMH